MTMKILQIIIHFTLFGLILFAIIATLFKILHWPGADIYLITAAVFGLTWNLLNFVFKIIKEVKN